MLNLFFKPLQGFDDVKKPIQAHETDAGWDIFSTEETIVYPNKQQKLSTGIAVQGSFVNPEDANKWKIEFKIEGTSGNAAKLGLFPIGGVIDQDYIGEIGVILVNTTADPIKIEKNKKIAQLVPYCIPKINSVKYLLQNENFESTVRGINGFGSTGIAN